MVLEELIKGLKTVSVCGQTDIEITGVNIDSRRIKEGHRAEPRWTDTSSYLRLSNLAQRLYSARFCQRRKPRE